ncbi:hypothetical protein BCR39DRAFT_169024 [Naematelia encephala]|uniref:Uncharacterized protein n=1 Tax=Naematelia encephala TaxID=71784 RepID=A0A1Y2B3V0_9TREE|nr:hypothetical protein BCR39DRAFT_169024 [Naematelia encephala]
MAQSQVSSLMVSCADTVQSIPKTIVVEGDTYYWMEAHTGLPVSLRSSGWELEQRDFEGVAYFKLTSIEVDTTLGQEVPESLDATGSGGPTLQPDREDHPERGEASTMANAETPPTTTQINLPSLSKKAVASIALVLVTTVLLGRFEDHLSHSTNWNVKLGDFDGLQARFEKAKKEFAVLSKGPEKLSGLAKLYHKSGDALRVLGDDLRDTGFTPDDSIAWTCFISLGLSGPLGRKVAAAGMGALAMKRAFWD